VNVRLAPPKCSRFVEFVPICQRAAAPYWAFLKETLMPAPHANPESPANSAAREMLEMQLQQVREVLTQAGLDGSSELLGQLVVAFALNYQTQMLKR
jgi:hypothetical protein